MSFDTKFSNHCSRISSIAYSRIYLLLKSFISNNAQLLLKAYKVYVRPVLESCTQVWSPHLLKDIICIEKVQKYFTRIVCKRCRITYTDYLSRLIVFQLESLEYRRVKFDLYMTYKIVHNLVDLPFSDFFTFSNSKYFTRSHSKKFTPRNKYINDTRRFFYSERIIKVWNSLPDHIVISPSLSAFKSNLKNYDLKCHAVY